MAQASIAGLILAGGRSSRMGRDKALTPFAGRPLIAHAIDRLRPQVATLVINANGDPQRFTDFGLPVIGDVAAGQPGPLAGIAAGLAWARERDFAHIVTAPCDAPFLSLDLVGVLVAASGPDGAAVAESRRGVEPLFALWPIASLPAVEAALASGDAAVWKLLDRLHARRALIPVESGADWSLNLNAPDDIVAAENRGHMR